MVYAVTDGFKMVPFKDRPWTFRMKVYWYEYGRKLKFMISTYDVEIFTICVGLPIFLALEYC